MAKRSSPSRISRILGFIFRFLFTIFAILTIVFIFSNSLEIGTVSSARSQEVTALLNRYITQIGLSPLSEYAVRKMAHFAEYMLLGFWFMLCLRVYTFRYIRHISWPLLLVLAVANVDETIQLYVSNRSSSVKDVWIDFGGGCAGIFVGLLLVMLLGSFWFLLGFGRHKRR